MEEACEIMGRWNGDFLEFEKFRREELYGAGSSMGGVDRCEDEVVLRRAFRFVGFGHEGHQKIEDKFFRSCLLVFSGHWGRLPDGFHNMVVLAGGRLAAKYLSRVKLPAQNLS